MKQILVEPTACEIIPGNGVEAEVDGVKIVAGNRRWMNSNEIEITDEIEAMLTKYEMEGKTAMVVGLNGHLAGLLAVQDTPKFEASAVVNYLENTLGIEVWMCTGDNAKTASVIAEQLGITRVIAEVLPEQKSSHVHKLHYDGKVVAMVGDGVNDAPALGTFYSHGLGYTLFVYKQK